MINHFFTWLISRPIWRILLVVILLVLAVLLHEGSRLWVRILGDAWIIAEVRSRAPITIPLGPPEMAACTDCVYYPVDKLHALPAAYEPLLVDTNLTGGGMVTPDTQTALGNLFDEAHMRGLTPRITSAYRSYAEQARTFNAWVAQEFRQTGSQSQAITNAARYSAWPGHSEHQLGTVVDLNCDGCEPFDDNDMRNLALWEFLAETAHRFGFVISYPPHREAQTGYTHEPWHIRYVGVEYATWLFECGYLTGNSICLPALLRYQDFEQQTPK